MLLYLDKKLSHAQLLNVSERRKETVPVEYFARITKLALLSSVSP